MNVYIHGPSGPQLSIPDSGTGVGRLIFEPHVQPYLTPNSTMQYYRCPKWPVPRPDLSLLSKSVSVPELGIILM